MIINIRGGCGAGKSTLVKQIINELVVEHVVTPLPGRVKPSGYVLKGSVFVVGHYEIRNGGLDTIGNLDVAYGMILERAHSYHVLYEGMNQKSDTHLVCEMNKKWHVTVIMLTTSYEECLESFRAKGQKRDEKYVEQTYRKAYRDVGYLQAAGVRVLLLNRADALAETRRLLCST